MKSINVLALSLLLSLSAAAAYADQFKLVSLQYPPYIYEESGEVTGFMYDVVSEVFKRMGHNSSTKIHAWPRSLEQVKTGTADAIYTAYKNDERVKFLDYSTTVLMPQEVVLFAPKGSDISFDGDFNKLKDLKIGIVRDISYGTIFDGVMKKGDIVKVDAATNLEQTVKKFEAGRVDLIISNKYTALSMFKKLGFQGKFEALPTPVQSVPSYIAFSKENNLAGVRDEFDRVLQGMIEDGTYDSMINKYVD